MTAKTSKTGNDLRWKIEIILSQVEAVPKIYNERTFADAIRSAALTGQAAELYQLVGALEPQPDLVALPGKFVVTNPQVQLLRAFYASLPVPRQRQFVRLLLAQTGDRTVRVIIHTLLDLGRLRAVEKFLSGSKLSMFVRAMTWEAIKAALSHEPHRFGEQELVILERMQVADRKRFPELQYEPGDSLITPPRNYKV